jgi:hypothetical protein
MSYRRQLERPVGDAAQSLDEKLWFQSLDAAGSVARYGGHQVNVVVTAALTRTFSTRSIDKVHRGPGYGLNNALPIFAGSTGFSHLVTSA